MLVKGKGGVAEFSEDNAGDPAIRQLMSKVKYEADSKYEVKDMPAWLQIMLKSGARLTHEVPQVRGDARNPVPLPELMEKFEANTAFLSAAHRSRITDDIMAFEKRSDVRSFMTRLAAA
jgi:2-methylcitrate dehydratase PrpD